MCGCARLRYCTSISASLSQRQSHEYLMAWRLAGCILESEASGCSVAPMRQVSLPSLPLPPPTALELRAERDARTSGRWRKKERQREEERESCPVCLRLPPPLLTTITTLQTSLLTPHSSIQAEQTPSSYYYPHLRRVFLHSWDVHVVWDVDGPYTF